MSNVNDLVQKAVTRINENNQAHLEQNVRDLVGKIFSTKADIDTLQEKLDGYKSDLKKLEMPVPVSLEV